MDMGPYYLTAYVSLFGPVKRLNGFARNTFGSREITAEKSPARGTQFTSEVDTYISAGLEFENGLIANLTTTWDMPYAYWESGLPLMEIMGSEGTLIMPDPNSYGGIGGSPKEKPSDFVCIRRLSGRVEQIPLLRGYKENSRGLGVADLARCIRSGGKPLVTGEAALHVLEMMTGILESSKTGKYYEMKTTCLKPLMLDEV